MGLSSTIIYTSELILCSTICVPSATRHNIHMYPLKIKLSVRFFQPGLKILARFDHTGLGFSARAELRPGEMACTSLQPLF